MKQSIERTGRIFGFTASRLAALTGLLLALFMIIAPVPAAEKGKSDFNHQSTGFPLTGAHAQQECQTCHVRGIFKGTPKQCEQCHTQGSRLGNTAKPANHVPTTLGCAQCHGSTTTWKGARFSHAQVKPGTCATCHGVSATGKPANHISTTAACDACHRTTAWIPATSGALPNGHRPIVAGTACSACHVSSASAFTHPRVTTGCASCHNGTYARAKTSTATHNFAGTNTCETCHRSTASFTGATFSHTFVTPGQCANCHNGSNPPAVGKPQTGHVATTAACDTCHRTTAWIPATFSHTGAGIAGNCISCHNGSTATGKSAKPNHVVTSAQCDVCHRTTAWVPATFNHSSTNTAQCDSCHNGSSATGKNARPNHVVTSAQCSTCHRTTAWIPATFNHASANTVNNCSSCHNGTSATGKTGSHFITQRQCDQCHTTSPPWTTVRHTHTSAAYVQHSSGVSCRACHVGGNEVITWRNAAYAQSCAGCHASDYRTGPHKKTEVPTTISYTVSDLRNCAGSCHQYTDNTFTTILRSRSGQHRATSGGF